MPHCLFQSCEINDVSRASKENKHTCLMNRLGQEKWSRGRLLLVREAGLIVMILAQVFGWLTSSAGVLAVAMWRSSVGY